MRRLLEEELNSELTFSESETRRRLAIVNSLFIVHKCDSDFNLAKNAKHSLLQSRRYVQRVGLEPLTGCDVDNLN